MIRIADSAGRLGAWFAAALILAALTFAAIGSASADTTAEKAFNALYRVNAKIPESARTAGSLGTERRGHGVLIDSSGLIVTIGYLILEADEVWVTTGEGVDVDADIIAYDHGTGFGLVRTREPTTAEPLTLGDSDTLNVRAPVLAARSGGPEMARPAYVVSRREFAGYWEYLLESAIFTSPPINDWGGAALIGVDGSLLGIGSLLVGDALRGAQELPGNMFVPINLLKPILADLLSDGRSAETPRPWLGIYSQEIENAVVVTRVAQDGPADKAGVEPGDVLLAVSGQPIDGMADFYRKVWDLGEAGAEVPLMVLRDEEPMSFDLSSGDRYDWLRIRHPD
ncbi:MAG: S1C family serine protease [Alphaproteobacteria bacterium]|nr:S1C family serine protease [Alphaproteobacteria bacterium]